MSIKLTIAERFDLLHHVARLPSTIALRFAIDEFQSLVDFDEGEKKEFGIVVDKNTFAIKSNDEDYTKEFTSFPPAVLTSMSVFIVKYDVDEMKNNEFVQDTLTLFKRIVDAFLGDATIVDIVE